MIGTSGALTDAVLRSAGLELVAVGNGAAFAARVARLAYDEDRRAQAAEIGRRLFDTQFTADAIAGRFLDGIA